MNFVGSKHIVDNPQSAIAFFKAYTNYFGLSYGVLYKLLNEEGKLKDSDFFTKEYRLGLMKDYPQLRGVPGAIMKRALKLAKFNLKNSESFQDFLKLGNPFHAKLTKSARIENKDISIHSSGCLGTFTHGNIKVEFDPPIPPEFTNPDYMVVTTSSDPSDLSCTVEFFISEELARGEL